METMNTKNVTVDATVNVKEEIVMNKNTEVRTDKELIFLEKEIDERFYFVKYYLCYSDGIVVTIYKSTEEFKDIYNKCRKGLSREYNKTYLHYLDLLMNNRYVVHDIKVRDVVDEEEWDIMLEYLPKQICGGYNRLIKFLRDFNDEVSKDKYDNKFCNNKTYCDCGVPYTTHIVECILGTLALGTFYDCI